MKDILLEVLQTVIIAVVPVIAGYIAVQIKTKITSNIKNETERKYADQIASAVSDAVLMTSQTYVDALKKENQFGKENQIAAARMALDACLASLTPDCMEFLKTVYTDIESYLSNKIEAEVKRNKDWMQVSSKEIVVS